MYKVIDIKDEKGSRKVAKISIDKEFFIELYNKKLEEFKKELEIKGFRKGKAPLSVIESHVGKEEVKNLAVEDAISYVHTQFLKDEKIDAIGRPDIEVIKADFDSGIEYVVSFYVMPEVNLPDYKKISKKHTKEEIKIKVIEKEIDDELKKIKKEILFREKIKDARNENDIQKAKEEIDKIKKLPTLTKEQLSVLGDFKSEKELKDKIKKEILEFKKIKEEEKLRIKILDDLLKNTDIDLPEVLIDAEYNNIMNMISSDLASNGLNIEQYLKEIKKSKDEFEKEIRKKAEEKVKAQLIISKIAEKENIQPEKDEIEKEVTKILSMYKDVDTTSVYNFVISKLISDKVFEFLTSKKSKK